MRYTCPVCAFKDLEAPPRNYEICPCCGTEFGNDDEARTHAQLRTLWIHNGARWFFREPPPNWNPWYQLIAGDLAEDIPFRAVVVPGTASANATEGNSQLARVA
jgi:hypothetical protein